VANGLCKLTLAEYIQACTKGLTPKTIVDLASQSPESQEIVCILSALGWMEPAGAWRPPACESVIEVEDEIVVGPATRNTDGSTTPSQGLAIPICAPLNKSLVIEILRIQPGNLTAAQGGRTLFKKVNLGGFGEFCLPFEPATKCGRFANVEHIVVCPGGSFSLFAENCNPCSEAVFNLHARMWAAC
jgi:hypothetical protein